VKRRFRISFCKPHQFEYFADNTENLLAWYQVLTCKKRPGVCGWGFCSGRDTVCRTKPRSPSTRDGLALFLVPSPPFAMSEAIGDPPPVATRISTRIRSKTVSKVVETSTTPAPGCAKGVPAKMPPPAAVGDNNGGQGKTGEYYFSLVDANLPVYIVPKKRGRPKGSTKSAKAQKAMALAAEPEVVTTPAVETDNPPPPPYVPSVAQSEHPSVQEEDDVPSWNPQSKRSHKGISSIN
jgi:hypothetical protein